VFGHASPEIQQSSPSSAGRSHQQTKDFLSAPPLQPQTKSFEAQKKIGLYRKLFGSKSSQSSESKNMKKSASSSNGKDAWQEHETIFQPVLHKEHLTPSFQASISKSVEAHDKRKETLQSDASPTQSVISFANFFEKPSSENSVGEGVIKKAIKHGRIKSDPYSTSAIVKAATSNEAINPLNTSSHSTDKTGSRFRKLKEGFETKDDIPGNEKMSVSQQHKSKKREGRQRSTSYILEEEKLDSSSSLVYIPYFQKLDHQVQEAGLDFEDEGWKEHRDAVERMKTWPENSQEKAKKQVAYLNKVKLLENRAKRFEDAFRAKEDFLTRIKAEDEHRRIWKELETKREIEWRLKKTNGSNVVEEGDLLQGLRRKESLASSATLDLQKSPPPLEPGPPSDLSRKVLPLKKLERLNAFHRIPLEPADSPIRFTGPRPLSM